MTVEKLITDHIDIWSSALQTRSMAGRGSNGKIDLYGIKKLRELILELAVRGKLVPQDPNDEPASELLKRIAVEKAELVKQGKIKKQKPLPEISEDEKPFELPVGWEWVRLAEAFDVRDGTHDTPKYQISGYPLVTSKNLSSGRLDLSDIKYISEEDYKKINERSFVERGDVLFAMIGSIGNPVVIDIDDEFSIKNVALFKYYKKELSQPYFLKNVLEALSVNLKIASSGGVQPFVSLGALRNIVIAFPPLEEQRRIMMKLSELMSLCDQLEQQSLSSLDAHQQLVETLLATLTDSQNAEELAENWARISQHFDALFTTEASIDTLKQTILQLAVMGKLVPQDPSDEPASELLKRIEQEKAQLVKEGKIKKQKPLPPVSEEEKNVVLPNGWIQARVDDVFNIIVDCPHSTAKFVEKGVLCIDTNTFKNGRLINDKFRFVSYDTYKERVLRLEPIAGDIVFAREGSVGESVVIPDDLKCCLGQRVMLLRPSPKMNSELLRYLLSSKKTLEELLSLHKGIGAKHVNVKDIKKHVIALPPENEQNRILVKINDMYVLCDQLKSRLQSAQRTQLHLADALTEAALN
ncbi:restriction endonuclease subunit S [Enterobacter sp. CC120223-11]|uniref:restriction endonuclease subunit S n=1 Tax=Enterobacter sp. CC120223-11 TaxID=1378073 RepID=UPI000BD92E5B|nr:restriction endonuclease subunit S [Enterobacter sp. CC120223-11]SNY63035.1 type I restriction enzyme, S subunit [Enterobacter sp. CC120223-11]